MYNIPTPYQYLTDEQKTEVCLYLYDHWEDWEIIHGTYIFTDYGFDIVYGSLH